MNFLVMSHLRWNFVFQRPQHLMTRCANSNRVFFYEEPLFDTDAAFLQVTTPLRGLHVVVPHLPSGLNEQEIWQTQQVLLKQLLTQHALLDYVLWYYTPMALNFTRELKPATVIYDCMDELSAFRNAPPGLRAAEKELFERANLVLTGGQTLFESKRNQHASCHCFPSSIDREFFAKAREIRTDTPAQAQIPRPRLGYCGVIDERVDLDLIAQVAGNHPHWQIVMLGPVVKVSESELPRSSNIHYLGAKEYRHLPEYLAGWDVGILPFALNESTRFISPTKTPEYLAAGLPVVSTPITDVVEPYGRLGLVEIADSPAAFAAAVQAAIPSRLSAERLRNVDLFLARNSWDLTWEKMVRLIHSTIKSSRPVQTAEPTLSELFATT
jgi:glycosyltransferase involved in cell wall biosynthesis